ncbi:MAG: cyclase [Leptolyngbya sp. SIO1D8]|nr:cyclase [Leptolyngbya sp. SIO1D8]
MVSSGLLSQQPPTLLSRVSERSHTQHEDNVLRQGGVLVNTYSHGLSGGAVIAKIYVKASRQDLWPKLTNYSRWVDYFPNITRSDVIASSKNFHRLYQVGRKAFLAIAAQVEIYLKVYEQSYRSIQFRLEKGTFKDFGADLTLQDWQDGTLLTYTVQATPLIPVPGFLIEQGMRQDLPGNMKHLRSMLCQ